MGRIGLGARVELMRRGSAALGEALRGEGDLSDGQLTLADEPAARDGLSRAAHAGELSPADEEV